MYLFGLFFIVFNKLAIDYFISLVLKYLRLLINVINY